MAGPTVESTELRRYSGLQRAAALMLALGPEQGTPIWTQLSEEEIKELSGAIAQLGPVNATVIEQILNQFVSDIGSLSSLHGSLDSTERLLTSVLPADKVREILEDIRGPTGRTIWDKLANVPEGQIAHFLRNEYPQTIAVVLSKLRADHAARIVSQLPETLATDVILRMLRMEPVSRETLLQVEATLKTEFMSNLARSTRRDPHEAMAELFNALDRTSEERLLDQLESRAPEAAERIRALMFTFEDLQQLPPQAMQVLVRKADKAKLALAMKGAPEDARNYFLSNMATRAAGLLRETLADMGPQRMRDVEAAQGELVRLAKSLAETGEILLADSKSEEELVF